MISLSEKKRPI